jgi:hypothetical protein
MSRGWKPTDLVMGEDLVLPDEFFEMPRVARNRIEYCVYAGETDTCIIVEIRYKKGFCSEDSGLTVQKFIEFASIWCGDVKIYRQDRTLLKVERENPLDMTVHNGYRWHDKESRKGKYGI